MQYMHNRRMIVLSKAKYIILQATVSWVNENDLLIKMPNTDIYNFNPLLMV